MENILLVGLLWEVDTRRITFRMVRDKSASQGVVRNNDTLRGQKVQGEDFFEVRYVT